MEDYQEVIAGKRTIYEISNSVRIKIASLKKLENCIIKNRVVPSRHKARRYNESGSP